MAFVHGKDSYFKIGSTDVTGYVTKVSFKPSSDTGGTTTFGLSSKTFLAGLKDCTITFDYNWDATLDAALYAVYGAATTFEYGPAGSGGGSVKYSGACILTDYGGDSDVSNVVSGSGTLQVSGTVSRGTY